ncbi:MAG: RsmE family RNA methyltransferase, partial [Spirochaetaceae bacterium]
GRMNRILFEPFELTADNRVTLPGVDERVRHIRRVLKLSPGDRFRSGLVNGPGATATLLSVDRELLLVSVEFGETPLLPPDPVTLLLSHPRPIVLKRMLKDLTTLGVKRMIIFPGERGEKSYFDCSLWEGEGYRRFLIDGAMQAGSTMIPEVVRKETLPDALSEAIPTDGARLLAADEAVSHDRTLFRALREGGPFRPEEPAVLSVGAERGWSDSERAVLREAGFYAFSLGPRVLRTETAALVVTSAVVEQYHRDKQPGDTPR